MANFLDRIFCHFGAYHCETPSQNWHLHLTGLTVRLTGKGKPSPLAPNDAFLPDEGAVARWSICNNDMAAYAARATVVAPPATRFAYSSPSVQLLARII